jgi:hypothetical protein
MELVEREGEREQPNTAWAACAELKDSVLASRTSKPLPSLDMSCDGLAAEKSRE